MADDPRVDRLAQVLVEKKYQAIQREQDQLRAQGKPTVDCLTGAYMQAAAAARSEATAIVAALGPRPTGTLSQHAHVAHPSPTHDSLAAARQSIARVTAARQEEAGRDDVEGERVGRERSDAGRAEAERTTDSHTEPAR
jgi:hypothetical protein